MVATGQQSREPYFHLLGDHTNHLDLRKEMYMLQTVFKGELHIERRTYQRRILGSREELHLKSITLIGLLSHASAGNLLLAVKGFL